MTTATEASVEHVPFKVRISKMGIADLREIASEEFGLNIDEKLKKEVVIDQLLRIYEEKTFSARSLNEKSAALFLTSDPNERMISVKFLPLDFSNAPIEFCYDGGHGIRDPKNPKKNPKGLSKVPRFKLIPGEIYKLPIVVIRHLESRTYRDSKPVFDPVSGMITGNIPVIKPRFMLQVVLTDDQLRELGTDL